MEGFTEVNIIASKVQLTYLICREHILSVCADEHTNNTSSFIQVPYRACLVL